MAGFGYTNYSFSRLSHPVEENLFYALHNMSDVELQEMLDEIRSKRWIEFARKQSFLLFFVALIPVCFIFVDKAPICNLGIFWGFISGLSILISAISFAAALSEHTKDFRDTRALFINFSSYNAYLAKCNKTT